MLFQYETTRLVLKILKPEHAALVLDFYNRDRKLFEKYEFPRLPDFYTVGHHQKILRFEFNSAMQMNSVRFYAFLKSDPSKIIGTVCLHNISHNFYHSCELGYKFSSEFHHQGYATEAILQLLSVAYNELHLHRVSAMVCHDNQPSIMLLKRIGFNHEGTCRDFMMLGDRWQDHHMFAMTADDYSSILQSQ